MGLGGASWGEGVEDREAAVGERGRGRGVHDRVTTGIDHVTCHRGGRGGDDRGGNTGCRGNKWCIDQISVSYLAFHYLQLILYCILLTVPKPLSVLATFFLFLSDSLRSYIYLATS